MNHLGPEKEGDGRNETGRGWECGSLEWKKNADRVLKESSQFVPFITLLSKLLSHACSIVAPSEETLSVSSLTVRVVDGQINSRSSILPRFNVATGVEGTVSTRVGIEIAVGIHVPLEVRSGHVEHPRPVYDDKNLIQIRSRNRRPLFRPVLVGFILSPDRSLLTPLSMLVLLPSTRLPLHTSSLSSSSASLTADYSFLASLFFVFLAFEIKGGCVTDSMDGLTDLIRSSKPPRPQLTHSVNTHHHHDDTRSSRRTSTQDGQPTARLLSRSRREEDGRGAKNA